MSIVELKKEKNKHHFSEAALIARVQAGSTAAFEQLINGLEAKMLGVAISLATSRDQADDIYQEAMISAYKAMPKFRGDSQFSTWLYRIVVNTAMTHKRRLLGKLSQLISFNHEELENFSDNDIGTSSSFDGNLSNANNPESQTHTRQLRLAIRNGLKTLAEKERIAFVLCHEQGLKIHHAASIMDVTDGAVKSYLFRAREKMKIQLQDFMR